MMEQAHTSRREPGRFQLPNLVAGIVIGGLLVGAVAPLVGSDGGVQVASEEPGFLDESQEEATTEFAASNEPGSGGETAVAGTEPGAGAAGEAVTSPDAADPGAAASTPAGVAAPGAGSGGAAAAPAAAQRTASDVGVTPDSIRVGSMLLNCKACAALGVTNLDSTSHGTIAKAFVDDVNRRGGIHGRKLELHTAEYDPAEDAVNGGGTERAACLELTQRRKVFAVMVGAVFANACVYDENKTTLLTSGDVPAEDPATFDRSNGRLWLLNPTSGRILLDWARQLDRQRLLEKSTKFGIVVLDGPHRQQVERYLLPELKRLGYTPSHVTILPNDAATIPVKTATEVPAMRGAGVTHVLMAAEYLTSQTWIRESQRNGWKPQYLQSDFPAGAHDYQGDQNSQAGDWTGAIAVSAIPERTAEQARQESASKRCLEIYEQASGSRPSDTLSGWVITYCNAYGLFERAANAAGPDLTRQRLAQALAGLGEFPVAGAMGGVGRFGGRYSLGNVKWSAAEYGQRKVYRKPCPRAGNTTEGCYVPEGAPYRMAA